MSKKQKKRTKRKTVKKFYHLWPKGNRKVLRDLIDYDYINQLSDKEKLFLEKFSRENYGADFRHKGVLNKSLKQRRKLYVENNRRNEDAVAISKNINKLDELEDRHATANFKEDAMLEILDQKLSFQGFFDLKNGKNKARNAGKKNS